MSRTQRGLAAAAFVAMSTIAGDAITNGQPDNNEHPFVGQLLFLTGVELRGFGLNVSIHARSQQGSERGFNRRRATRIRVGSD